MGCRTFPRPTPPCPLRVLQAQVHATVAMSSDGESAGHDDEGAWNGEVGEADEELAEAAEYGDVAGIAAALLAGANPNVFEGVLAITPLQRAATEGHVPAIVALLQGKARVDGADCHGTTPLMLAAEGGHIAAMTTLIDAGAGVNRAYHDGSTVLHRAAKYGSVDAARVLLHAGAWTQARCLLGKLPIDVVSALVCAVSEGRGGRGGMLR
jgi:ankyrin repeat protein